MFRVMRKYAHLYGMFIKNCLIAQMEFRGNFMMSLLVESVYLLAKLLYVLVVFYHTIFTSMVYRPKGCYYL